LLSTKKHEHFTPAKHFLKPSLIESRVAESPDTFNQLGEGFKKLFLGNTGSSHATIGLQSAKDIKCPTGIQIGSSSP